MPPFRLLFGGRTRSSNRSLDDDQKETYKSGTSLEVEEKRTKAPTKQDGESEWHGFKQIRNKITLIGSIFRRRIPKRESITIHCLDDSLLAQIYQCLSLVD